MYKRQVVDGSKGSEKKAAEVRENINAVKDVAEANSNKEETDSQPSPSTGAQTELLECRSNDRTL